MLSGGGGARDAGGALLPALPVPALSPSCLSFPVSGSSAGLSAHSLHPRVTSWGARGGPALPQLTQGRVEELAGSLAMLFFFLLLFIFPVP